MTPSPIPLVLTLIANPAGPPLQVDTASIAFARVPNGSPRWLDVGVAAEVAFHVRASEATAIEDDVRAAIGAAPLDVVVQPAQGRRKKLLVADMDSTIIGQECVDELAERMGIGAEVAAITGRSMRGEVAFEPALRERVALLAGMPEAIIAEVIAERVRLMPGAKTLIGTMRAHGATTALLSGGFTAFTGAVAAMAGFDHHRANTLVIAEGKLAGTVVEPVFGRSGKLAALRELREALGLDRSETMAVGDGANDIAMIEEAGLGVAFHGKPVVAAAADVRIEHGDLTALLYLQGYSRAEFAG
ncbi:MAG: phosphoserine phosphatase SerB [Bauldia sp.]|nr:phosphoserine phosphatase SerB [Bauldia sp.]